LSIILFPAARLNCPKTNSATGFGSAVIGKEKECSPFYTAVSILGFENKLVLK